MSGLEDDLRRRFAAAFEPEHRVPTVPIIGRGCITAEHFTREIARVLGYPQLQRAPDETDEAFLIRRLEQLKFWSRPWANCRLESLSPDLLRLAAMQICDCAANAAQDRVCEPAHRRKLEQPR